MTRHRSPRVLKWVGTTACVLVVVAWVYTALGGTVSIGYDQKARDPKIILSDGGVSVSLGWGWLDTNPPRQKYLGHLSIPLLVILLILAVPTAVLWLVDRRHVVVGRCMKCGYDLTGNVSGVCPECGKPLS